MYGDEFIEMPPGSPQNSEFGDVNIIGEIDAECDGRCIVQLEETGECEHSFLLYRDDE